MIKVYIIMTACGTMYIQSLYQEIEPFPIFHYPGALWSNFANSSFLASRFSTMASMTRSVAVADVTGSSE